MCSHQSIFETLFLQTLFNNSVFILKKELTKIPLFGWYLKKLGCISIDRNKVSKENLNFSEDVGKIIKNTNKILIIFPQGTRKNPDDRSKFKKGFSRIYNDLNIACLPVAINSGKVWPKKGGLVPNQKITISILKLIISPLILLILGYTFFSLSNPINFAGALLVSVGPCGATSIVMCSAYNVSPENIIKAIFISTFASIFTFLFTINLLN